MKNNLLSLPRMIPLLIVSVIFLLIIFFRLYDYLSFASLAEHHQQLQQWTTQHYWVVVSAFMLIYIIVVGASVPGAFVLTIASGYLFGYFLGTLYVVIAATIGASIIFLAVKTALGDFLAAKAKGWVARMEKGFRANAFSYLLFLRLVPLFPFAVVNIVPAILGVSLRIFFVATLIGIIPGTFVFASVGRGLESIIDAGKTPNAAAIFQPEIFLPIMALALLALLPVLFKKFRQKNRG